MFAGGGHEGFHPCELLEARPVGGAPGHDLAPGGGAPFQQGRRAGAVGSPLQGRGSGEPFFRDGDLLADLREARRRFQGSETGVPGFLVKRRSPRRPAGGTLQQQFGHAVETARQLPGHEDEAGVTLGALPADRKGSSMQVQRLGETMFRMPGIAKPEPRVRQIRSVLDVQCIRRHQRLRADR